MKILYGVQATGNGHISRSRVMAKYFKEKNADVTFLFSGRDPKLLFDMEIFGDFTCRRGLTFNTRNGSIDYLQTVLTNNIFEFIGDIKKLNVEDYDLVITDFEPVTAWAAKLKNIPCIGLGHQYAFGPNTPLAGESFIAKKIMKHFAPAKQAIGLHWSQFDPNVFPPIIDVNLERVSTDDTILVYLPFENQTEITQLLIQFSKFDFIQYSHDLTDSESSNVKLRKTCYQGFKDDLRKAKGVICNSGFELNSECIHLGLPILTKPIKGQMEQISNALAIEQLSFGQTMETVNKSIIRSWLDNLPPQKQQRLPDVAKEIVDWIVEIGRASCRERVCMFV